MLTCDREALNFVLQRTELLHKRSYVTPHYLHKPSGSPADVCRYQRHDITKWFEEYSYDFHVCISETLSIDD